MCIAETDPRHHMWCRLIGGYYADADRHERRRLKLAYCEVHGIEFPNMIEPEEEDMKMSELGGCPLDCCKAATISTPYRECDEFDSLVASYTPKKKDNNMRAYSDSYSAPSASVNITAPEGFNAEQTAQEHLLTRLSNAYWEKNVELQKTYYLYNDGTPATIKEMLDRVKAGDYKFNSDYKDEYVLSQSFEDYENPFRLFEWRKFPADRAGYDKAILLLDKARQEVMDAIKVLGSKEGLTALKAFEAQSFTVQ